RLPPLKNWWAWRWNRTDPLKKPRRSNPRRILPTSKPRRLTNMPELRRDPITGRWVIISTERSKRPSEFSTDQDFPQGGTCPFCPGFEDKTPPEILAYYNSGREKNKPGWWV